MQRVENREWRLTIIIRDNLRKERKDKENVQNNSKLKESQWIEPGHLRIT